MEIKQTPRGIKAVAALELLKGGLALVGGIWFLLTLGEDWSIALESMIARFAPSLTLPERVVEFLQVIDPQKQAIAALALLAYAALHLVEGVGLWKSRHWAEWLGVISGGIYIPLELYEIARHPSWITLAILTINVAIVAYLIAVIKANPKRPLATA
ncbi:hypothetical protein VDG1235_4088 [Verrucomicrobiia bacterium DG1235]|nr:hypothetical protein VDG1235_4088 [Verrucomicrobiae bacterium DG1235]